jgi:hypothetical protein
MNYLRINMHIIITLVLFLAATAWADETLTFLNNQDKKVYSIKSKGIKDLVVDIESPKLTSHLNEQGSLGKVENVIFRVYWTASPERIAIDILGMPDGFREIKEQLKLNILPQVENILPPTTAQKFGGYKFLKTGSPREVLVQDTSGVAPIPSYVLRYDSQDRLIEIEGKKLIGEFKVTPVFDKEAFSEGRWVLKSQVSRDVTSGQTSISKKELSYGTHQGFGVVTKVALTNELRYEAPEVKPVISVEELHFKNYKINTGEALQHFLSDSNKIAP